jgi:hypothetical protein
VTLREVERAIRLMQGEYQLQEDAKAALFLSAIYNITVNGEVNHLANTEQILDGVEYAGSRYPTMYSPQSVAHSIARQAAADGIRGKLGIDVAVNAEGKYFVLECNPRWTGALYPWVIAQRLRVTEWSTVHMPVNAEHLKDIVLGHLEYNPSRRTGAVLVNWGGIRYHWLELLLVGSEEAQHVLYAQLAAVL